MVSFYKSYRVFLSGTWLKVLMYLVYPLVTFLWCGLIAVGMGVEKVYAMYILLITCSVIMWAELLLDNFVYGGILAKDTNKLEYLKTSYRGISVLKKSLTVDKVRRLVTMTLLLTIIYSVCHEKVSVGQLVSLILGTGAVMELGLLIIRHFSSFNWTVILAWVANGVGALVGFLAVKLAPIFAVLFLLLFVVIVMASNRVTMKKAERGFYDAGVEGR